MDPFAINYSDQLGRVTRERGVRRGPTRGGKASGAAQQKGVPRSEIRTQKVWDTLFLDGVSKIYRFFALPVGQNLDAYILGTPTTRKKQKSETNLRSANKLETGQRLVVASIYAKIDATDSPVPVAPAVPLTPEEILQIIGKSTLAISIAQVERFVEPMSEIPTGLDIYSTEVASRGVPSPKNVRELKMNPLDIPAGQSFEGVLEFDEATTADEIAAIEGIKLTLFLDGDFKRAVS